MGEKLNPRQEAFCREYMIDLNGTQAAIRAGYSEKGAEVRGSELLTNRKVQGFLAELAEKKCEKIDVTVDRVLKELCAIAFLDPIDLLKDDGGMKAICDMPEAARRAIGGLEIKTTWADGDGDSKDRVDLAKIKITDKGIALERLGKYLKMFSDGQTIKIPEDYTFTMVVHGAKDA